jgi:hypothetical protein
MGQVVNTCQPALPRDTVDSTCNQQDDDCDGQTDEGYVSTPTTCHARIGNCVGFGELVCLSTGEFDTCIVDLEDGVCNDLDK